MQPIRSNGIDPQNLRPMSPRAGAAGSRGPSPSHREETSQSATSIVPPPIAIGDEQTSGSGEGASATENTAIYWQDLIRKKPNARNEIILSMYDKAINEDIISKVTEYCETLEQSGEVDCGSPEPTECLDLAAQGDEEMYDLLVDCNAEKPISTHNISAGAAESRGASPSNLEETFQSNMPIVPPPRTEQASSSGEGAKVNENLTAITQSPTVTRTPKNRELTFKEAFINASFGIKAYQRLAPEYQRNTAIATAVLGKCPNALPFIPDETKNSQEFKCEIKNAGLEINSDNNATLKDYDKHAEWSKEKLTSSGTKAPIIPANLSQQEVLKNYHLLAQAPDTMRKDKIFILNLVSLHGYALKYAATELMNDPEVVEAAVRNAPSVLQYASDEVRGNSKICLLAVSQDANAYTNVRYSLKTDDKFANEAVKANPRVLYFMESDNIQKLKPEFLLTAIIKQPEYFRKIPEPLNNDARFIGELIKENPHVYLQMNESQKKLLNPDQILGLLPSYPEAIQLVPPEKKCNFGYISKAIDTRSVISYILKDPTFPVDIRRLIASNFSESDDQGRAQSTTESSARVPFRTGASNIDTICNINTQPDTSAGAASRRDAIASHLAPKTGDIVQCDSLSRTAIHIDSVNIGVSKEERKRKWSTLDTGSDGHSQIDSEITSALSLANTLISIGNNNLIMGDSGRFRYSSLTNQPEAVYDEAGFLEQIKKDPDTIDCIPEENLTKDFISKAIEAKREVAQNLLDKVYSKAFWGREFADKDALDRFVCLSINRVARVGSASGIGHNSSSSEGPNVDEKSLEYWMNYFTLRPQEKNEIIVAMIDKDAPEKDVKKLLEFQEKFPKLGED